MKLVLTGGHFSPAYALMQKLKGTASFVLIGRKHSFEGDSAESFEYRIAVKENIPFYELKTGRLQRKLSKNTLPSLIKFPYGVTQAVSILKKERPDIILSFGGYLALPVVIAGKILGVPIVIHEQTQAAGLANKISASFADKVLISFPDSAQFFPQKKTVLTGNPVRKEVFDIGNPLDIPKGKLIYVTGGSAGSHQINHLISSIVPQLCKNYVVLHQTGESSQFDDYDTLLNTKAELPENIRKNYILTKFIFPEHIGWVLDRADLIIGRSGINTISEIIALKKKALLIPLSHGQSGEQLSNAKLIHKIGLGEYLNSSEQNSERLLQMINHIFNNSSLYSLRNENKEYFHKNAVEKIVNELQSVYAQKKNVGSEQ